MRTTHRTLPIVAAICALTSAAAGQQGGWQPQADVVRKLSAARPDVNYDEAKVPPYLPADPLAARGGKVRTADEWKTRRAELLDLFRQHVYGRSPGRPDTLAFTSVEKDERAMDGAATLERVTVVSTQAGREHRFGITLFLPNRRSAERVPVFLLLNNRPASNTDPTRKEKSGFWPAEQIIAHGYGIAALQVADLAPDDKQKYRDGVINLFEGTTTGPRPRDAWAGLAAWAWGASRAMDYFGQHPRIDARRVAVVGHSRGGKAALWAGAEDERFSIVISNESGESGAALSRRPYGETIARITEVFPHWFAENYRGYAGRERDLPVDQHMLLSMIAPRALYVASADEDLWSDPRGEFLSLAHTSGVYGLWGEKPIGTDEMPALERPLVRGRRGYHIRPGVHNLTPYDWDRFADFAATIWK